MFWSCGRFRLNLSERPLIMGVLNVTPDSFSDGYPGLDAALKQADRLVEAGADILDVGGESTRPGSDSVSTECELERVLPVIEALTRLYDLPVSIDTQKAAVAGHALRSGVSIVNHVSASLDFESVIPLLMESNAGYVAMHMKDRPRVMQQKADYDRVVDDVINGLRAVADGLSRAGIHPDRVLFDPGIGFGKNLEHNLTLLARTRDMAAALGRPLLLGISRKSWMTRFFGTAAEAIPERDAHTMITSVLMPYPAVAVHRVHNVSMLNHALRLRSSLNQLSARGSREVPPDESGYRRYPRG